MVCCVWKLVNGLVAYFILYVKHGPINFFVIKNIQGKKAIYYNYFGNNDFIDRSHCVPSTDLCLVSSL